MKTNAKSSNWIITDPDTGQQGRQLSEWVFEFQQENEGITQIDLDEYTDFEQEDIINSFGYTLDLDENQNHPGLQNIHKLYGDSANWIIAECIYESEL